MKRVVASVIGFRKYRWISHTCTVPFCHNSFQMVFGSSVEMLARLLEGALKNCLRGNVVFGRILDRYSENASKNAAILHFPQKITPKKNFENF